MKKIIFILVLIMSFSYANTNSSVLSLFVQYNQEEIELKWFTPEYSSEYIYKIYKSEGNEKPKLIKEVKPISLEQLEKGGYSEDYIFMVYPYAKVKNPKEKIQVMQIEQRVKGFRLLKFMRDYAFAQNIGQYYKDLNVKKDKVYTYTVVAYKNKKEVYNRTILAHTYKKAKKYDFMWTKATPLNDEIGLRWDTQDAFAYYNVYRKLSNEKKFKKLNKNIIYISRDFATRAKFLYKDTSIKIGEKATYYIRKVDMFSKEGRPSSHFSAELKEKISKPQIIKDVFITNSDTKRVIRWSKSTESLGYNVYRSRIYQGNFRKINKELIKDEFYYDKNFQAGKNYYYYITASNLKGESLPSTIKLAYASDTTPPVEPTKFKAKTNKKGQIAFSWDKVKDTNLAGYRIYMSMDIDAEQWSLLNTELIKTNAYDYNMSEKFSRFPYFYRVSAVDGTFNESYPSNIVKLKLPDVTAPKQPFIKNFRAHNDKIILEWGKNTAYDLDHYNVYSKVDNKYNKLNQEPIFMSMFTDIKPHSGINQYVITAVDKSGNESLKTVVKEVKLVDNIPVKIEDFKLLKTKKGVEVSFTCKDKDYHGFKLFRRGFEEPNYTNVSNFVEATNFTDKIVSKKNIYYYLVKAYDKSGNISESNVLKMQIK